MIVLLTDFGHSEYVGVKTADHYFVTPDNGLLWETLKEQEIVDMRVIPCLY